MIWRPRSGSSNTRGFSIAARYGTIEAGNGSSRLLKKQTKQGSQAEPEPVMRPLPSVGTDGRKRLTAGPKKQEKT